MKHRLVACQDQLEMALDTIQIMTDEREEAVDRLDVIIGVLKEMEVGNMSEALRLISEACSQFDLTCL